MLLAAFLAIDLFFIAMFVFYGVMHVLYDWQRIPPLAWNLAADYSLPEFFSYFKLFFMCVVLGYVFLKSRIAMFASWSFVFCLMWLDDMLQWHERGGAWLVAYFGIPNWHGIRGQDFGELMLWSGLGFLYLMVLTVGILRSPRDKWHYSGYFFLVVCALIVFGVILDFFGASEFFKTTDDSSLIIKFLTGATTIAEDGGELMVLSFGAAGALGSLIAFGKDTGSVRETILRPRQVQA